MLQSGQATSRDTWPAFTEAGVEYLLIGGWAVAAHGHGRATDDIDLLVRRTSDHAARTYAALIAFGAPLPVDYRSRVCPALSLHRPGER